MKKIPDVLEHGVIYQINLRAFTPEGTLNAAAKMLPHLREIGADIVYLCPVVCADDSVDVAGWSDRQRASGFLNPKNPYRIADYANVDPEYGTNEDLRRFVAAAHALGLRVLLDLVYFHCGPNAVFLAEHPDFILRDAGGAPAVGAWRFPRLNFASQALREFLWENMALFVRDYGVDGYRCDVGDQVPLDFWAEGVRRLRELRPGVLMLNEGANPDALDVFDLNYSWVFRNAFSDCVEAGKPASEFAAKVRQLCAEGLRNTYRSIFFLDNHDTASDDYDNRLEKRIGFAAMNLGLVLNFLLPNVPFLYNGAEVADENRHSLWANRFCGANLVIDWQNACTERGRQRLALVRALRALRERPEFGLSAGLEFVDAGEALVFRRWLGGRAAAVLANPTDRDLAVAADLAARSPSVLLSDGAAVDCGRAGRVQATLKAHGYAVLAL